MRSEIKNANANQDFQNLFTIILEAKRLFLERPYKNRY